MNPSKKHPTASGHRRGRDVLETAGFHARQRCRVANRCAPIKSPCVSSNHDAA
jgi:hypothetical protein